MKSNDSFEFYQENIRFTSFGFFLLAFVSTLSYGVIKGHPRHRHLLAQTSRNN